MLELRKALEDQGWKVERESGTAFFYNFAPWIAPQAYLHIVFKAAEKKALTEIGNLIQLPSSWQDTLAMQNGASLYSNAIAIYGAPSPTAPLNRRDVLQRSPYSIVEANRSWPFMPVERFISIGGYSYNGTRVVLDRNDGSVFAAPRQNEQVLGYWASPDSWLNEELKRLSMLFDSEGKILVSREHTLPNWPSA